MHDELQAALESLRQHASPLRPPCLSDAGAMVVTGTGFFGVDRAAIRELAGLAGITYSGDLVNSSTTHLVLAPQCCIDAASGCGGNRKLAKAAVWGIPCVRLQWLLDSIARRSLQPTAPYLLAAAQQDGQQGVGLELQLPDSCHQLKSRNRPPSSTASNDVAAAAGRAERQEAASCQRQRVQRQEGLGRQPLQPSPLPRAALAPLHNTVLNQLQRMSLSPRAAPPPPMSSSPPEQCSPAGSPQLSLSLQGLLADGEAEAVPRQNSCSLGEASSKGLVAGGQPQGSPFYSPGGLGTAALLPAGQPGGCSPMWESPLGEQPQPLAHTPTIQHHAAAAAAAGCKHSPQPFSFSPALALQRSDSGGGLICSPMAASPAALLPATADMPFALPAWPSAAAAAGSVGHGALSAAACGGESPRLAAVEAAGVRDCSSQECTLPTPACIRDWSDDDSDCGTLPSAAPAHGLSAGRPADDGSSQTPPALRRALEGGLSPMPDVCLSQQQQQQQQQAAHEEEAECTQQMPAAIQQSHDWPDSDTEAAEPPSPAALVVADSESESGTDAGSDFCVNDLAVVQMVAQPAGVMQAEQQQAEPHVEARHQPPLPPQSQPKRLLQISRPSTSRGTAPGAAAATQSRHGAGSAAGGAPAAQVAAHPAGAEEAAAVSSPGEDEWAPPMTVGGNSQQLLGTNVRDWSDDGSSGSNGDEVLAVTTAGHRGKAKRGGLTGLTQLDPASIVVARPKAAPGSTTGSGGAVAIKWLQRPSRGNAVRQHHDLPNLKSVQFAEQVHIAVAGGLTLSTKDKKTAVQLQAQGADGEPAVPDEEEEGVPCGSSSLAAAAQQQGEPVLGEPQCFYCLPDGTWWLEYCRLYTAAQAEAAAAADGRTLALPHGFDRHNELLRAVERQHGTMRDVVGGVQVRRVKQGSAMLRLRGGTAHPSRSHFWRSSLDTGSWRLVTDRPTTDFVALH
ncbi:hypothetical protein D9Q98_005296 [Chlorella vulgaris]|uniref:BRCT domain-containing protein n=1 Tax=Chlorella vulgaris TaxID=3077 RepID=A0A9D4YWZ7_CHLVU|nr:hypothetical protein D9Q98_005296 [Chlorella vulgaris]